MNYDMDGVPGSFRSAPVLKKAIRGCITCGWGWRRWFASMECVDNYVTQRRCDTYASVCVSLRQLKNVTASLMRQCNVACVTLRHFPPAPSPPPTPQDSTPQNSSPTAPANPRRSPSPTVPILTQSASHRRSDRGRASSESPAPTPSTSNNAPAPNDRPQLPVPSTSNPAPAPNNNTPAPTIRPRPQRQGKAVYRR
ncbi:hypothetical protein C8J57DRAFT_1235871 [Mycena rebaudengoi]|nr:hypothetical protein C8J57DRAFT_1235871 [Mycena rebaudengoi]